MKNWLMWMVVATVTSGMARAQQREFAIDLWDWTAPCQDLGKFKAWAADFKKIGGTRIEISAPWNVLEPAEGGYQLAFVADRMKIAKEAGLGLRVRINSYYGGATPSWLKAEHWKDVKGEAPKGTPNPVSICDERFLDRFEKLCTTLARRFKGEDVYWSPFIGVHAELKWSDWWTYDGASLAKWRGAIAMPRASWLADVAGDQALPAIPAVPLGTSGKADLSAESRSFIAFREQCWREALERFDRGIRAGDRDAKTSAPLGESYRRQSAAFSNLDYVGLSRGFDQVVHSYDFYWHLKDDAWWAGAAVASFRGMTAKPVSFEFDGPALLENLGYTQEQLGRIADAVIEQGAGIKAANYSYYPKLPSGYPVLVMFGEKLKRAAAIEEVATKQTVLLFVSKWANYSYREKTQWLHAAQFGAWKMLADRGEKVRFICEDNLDEDLSGCRGLYVAYSPVEAMPAGALKKLLALESRVPSIVEIEKGGGDEPRGVVAGDLKLEVSGRRVVVGWPLAFAWLRGEREQCEKALDEAVAKSWGGRP